MTTVLLVDDEVDMRVLIRLSIEMANNGLRIVGEACDAQASSVCTTTLPREASDRVVGHPAKPLTEGSH